MRFDRVFVNGRIWTQDPARPWASALGVIGGRVVALDEDIDRLEALDRVDLRGMFCAPGFNDAHHHLSQRGYKLRQLDLRFEAAPSLAQLYELIEARVAALAPGEWVIGIGYDENRIGGHPQLQRLDLIAPRTPLWIQQVSGHLGVVNTEAARLIGLDPSREDPPGGRLGRSADGAFDGVLYEQAQEFVFDRIKPVREQDWLESIAYGNDLAVAEGITSAAEPGVSATGMSSNSVADIGQFRRAADSGALQVRMTLMPEIDALHDVGAVGRESPWFGVDLGITTGFGDDRVRLGAVKVFLDGSLIGRTAAMTVPYDNGDCGLFQGDPDEILSRCLAAHRDGWQLAVHAIGDAAIDRLLDTVAEAQRRWPRPDARHRLEHGGVIRDDQIARIAALGMVCVPQARFITELGDGMIRTLGERAPLAYRMRTLLDAGIVIAGSSDTPVVAGAPLLGLHDAVNRLTADGQLLGPHERLTVADALRTYTVGSAYASHAEQQVGTIGEGMLADLVILSEDLLAVHPSAISATEVVSTVIGGEIVYGEERL